MNTTTLSDGRDAEKGAWKNKAIKKCWESSLKGGRRPIWKASTWHSLQEKYFMIVGEEESTISLEQDNGLVIPYEIKHTAEKGRGIYATSKIKAGDLVWQPAQHAIFRKVEDFRIFLSSLSYDLACDVLMWSYVESCDCSKVGMSRKISKAFLPTPECYAVALELDDASFMNSISDGEEPNVSFDEEFSSSDESFPSDFAIRDIKPGEEIVIDYKSFDIDGKLKWFDDMANKAWWDGINDSEDSEDDYATMVRSKKSVEADRFFNISMVPFFLLYLLYLKNMRKHRSW